MLNNDLIHNNRELLHYLMHIEDYPNILAMVHPRLDQVLSAKNEHDDTTSIDFDSEIIDEFCEELKQWFSTNKTKGIECPSFPLFLTDTLKRLVTEFTNHEISGTKQAVDFFRLVAPTLLSQPCWLQNVATAKFGHTAESAYLFRIFARTVGNESEGCVNRNSIHLMLAQHGIPIPKMDCISDIVQSGIPDSVFTPPVIYLCLAQCLQDYFPEILGFTLAHVFSPLPASYGQLFKTINTQRISFPVFSEKIVADDRNDLLSAIRIHIAKRTATKPWCRIKSGLRLYLKIHFDLIGNIEKHMAQHQTLEQQVIQLFQRKAPYAAGHHRDLKLGERSLDEWFFAEPFEGERFLKQLLDSGYFDSAVPRNSLFLKQLTAFDGPMYGVFTAGELNTIIDWLEQIRSKQPHFSETIINQTTNPPLEKPSIDTEPVKPKYSSRDVYYHLLNGDCPDVLHIAKKRVKKVLYFASRNTFFGIKNPLGIWPYSHHAFENCIENLYQKEIKKYRRFEPPPKLGKEVYRWGILQFAPMILVDGCWLQHIARVEHWDLALNQKLFQIFADEIGNGFSEQNHPNVYRRLLNSLDIHLPPLESRAFSQHPDFLDAAFNVPLHLLAISHFPATFLPEIIGLNLAIELGGLGAIYQRLVDELDYHGIDSHIIRLHISIDNLASGHSAIAKDVVMLYLDQIASDYGAEVLQEHWLRIKSGYLSLNLVTLKFKLALLGGYCSRLLIPGILHSTRSFFRPISD